MSVGAEAGATADVGATWMDFRGAGLRQETLVQFLEQGTHRLGTMVGHDACIVGLNCTREPVVADVLLDQRDCFDRGSKDASRIEQVLRKKTAC